MNKITLWHIRSQHANYQKNGVIISRMLLQN